MMKKIVACFFAIILFFSNVLISANAENEMHPYVQRLKEILRTEYMIGVNNHQYQEFPLNFIIELPTQKVQYDYSFEQVIFNDPDYPDRCFSYDFELPRIDSSILQFEVLSSLKSSQNQATLCLYKMSSPKECFRKYHFTGSNTIKLEVSLDDKYYLNVETADYIYVGFFELSIDPYNKLSYDLVYCKHEKTYSDVAISFYENNILEIEEYINTIVDYNSMNIEMTGKSLSFTFIPEKAGDFSLLARSKADVDLFLYDANNFLICHNNSLGDSYIRTYVDKGKEYRIIIETDSDYSDVYLRATQNSGYKWYSQYVGGSSSFSGYWKTTNLNSVYFPNATNPIYAAIPFMLDNSTCLMQQGCFLTCWAMLLRNTISPSQLLSSYDLRWSDTSKYISLTADPFVVMLANTGLKDIMPSTIHNTATNRYAYTSFTGSTPVYCYRTTIVNAFGYTYSNDITEESFGTSNPLTATKIAAALSNAESGLIAVLNGGSHYIVITGDRGSSYSNPNDRFVICDPAATSAVYGDNIPWSSSLSSYTFSDITKIYYFG